jgi:hypothetical protein
VALSEYQIKGRAETCGKRRRNYLRGSRRRKTKWLIWKQREWRKD